MRTSTHVWKDTLARILMTGNEVSPRGKLTREILQHTVIVDMLKPVLISEQRKPHYRFMAAEAFWILSGDDRVGTIAPYNQQISQFSDDGVVFAGAYGPMVVDQIQYVVDKLVEDEDTRQAVMTIWRPNPKPSKDIPCTVAFDFMIRNGRLNVHAFMRSSDAWLGLPYDTFNFSMLGVLVTGLVNKLVFNTGRTLLTPGQLYLTMASSHLYQPNWDAANLCLTEEVKDQRSVPHQFFAHKDGPQMLMDTLKDLRDSKPGDSIRWWEL